MAVERFGLCYLEAWFNKFKYNCIFQSQQETLGSWWPGSPAADSSVVTESRYGIPTSMDVHLADWQFHYVCICCCSWSTYKWTLHQGNQRFSWESDVAGLASRHYKPHPWRILVGHWWSWCISVYMHPLIQVDLLSLTWIDAQCNGWMK